MAEDIENLTEPVSDGSTIGSFDDSDDNTKFSTALSESAKKAGICKTNNCIENALAKEQKEQENDETQQDVTLGDQKSFRAASVVIKTSNFKLDIQNDVGRDDNSKQLPNTSRREYYRRASNKRRKNKRRNNRKSRIYRGNKTSDRNWEDNVSLNQTARDDSTLLNRRDDKFTENDFRASPKSHRDDQLASRRGDNSSWYKNLDENNLNKQNDDDLSSKRLDENSTLLKNYGVDSSQRQRDEEYINNHDKCLDERLEQYKKSYKSYRDNRLQKQRNDSSLRKISDDNVSLDKYCADNSVSDKKRRGSTNPIDDDKLSFESNKEENLKTRHDDSDKSYMCHDDRFLYKNYKDHNKSSNKFVDNNVADKYQSSSKNSKNYQQQKDRKKHTSSHNNSSSDRRAEYNCLKRRLDDNLLHGHDNENTFQNDISVTKKSKYDKPLKKCDDDTTNRHDTVTSLQRQQTIDINQKNQEINSPTKCVESYKYSDQEIAKSRHLEDKHKNSEYLTERSSSHKKRKRNEVGKQSIDNPSKKYCEGNLLKKFYGNDDNQLSDDAFDEVHDDLASSHKVHNDTKQIKRRIDNVLQSLDSNETLSDETLNLKNRKDDISEKRVVNKSSKKHENINISLDKLRKYHNSAHKNIEGDKDNVKDYRQNVSLDDDKSSKKLRKKLSTKNRKNELKRKRSRKKHASILDESTSHDNTKEVEEERTAIDNSSYEICKDKNQIGYNFNDMFLEQIRRDVVLSIKNRKNKELEAANSSSSSCPLREIFKDKSEKLCDDITTENSLKSTSKKRRTSERTHSNQKKKGKTSFAVTSSDNYHGSKTLSYKDCQSDESQFEGEDILDLHDRDFCLSKQNADDNTSHKTGNVDIIGDIQINEVSDLSFKKQSNNDISDKHQSNNYQNKNIDNTPSYEVHEDIVSLIKDMTIDSEQFDDITSKYASFGLYKLFEDDEHDNKTSEKQCKKPIDTSHSDVTTSHGLFEINNPLDDNYQSKSHRTSEEFPGDKISSFKDNESENDSHANNGAEKQCKKPIDTSHPDVTTSHGLFEIVDDNYQSKSHRTSEEFPGDKTSSFKNHESENDSHANNGAEKQCKKPIDVSHPDVTTSHEFFEIVDDNYQSKSHRTSEELPGDKISSFKDNESENDSHDNNGAKTQRKKPLNTSRQDVSVSHKLFEINNFLVNYQNESHRISEELPGDKIFSFKDNESENDSHDNNGAKTQRKKSLNTSRQDVTASLSSHKEHLKNKNEKQCNNDMTLLLKNHNGDSLNSNIHNNKKTGNLCEDKITRRRKSVSNTEKENDHTSKTRSDYDRSTNSYEESAVSIRNISCKQSEYDNRKIREIDTDSLRLSSRDDNYSNQNESVKWDSTSNARNSYSSQYDKRTSFSTSEKNNSCDDGNYEQYRNSSEYRYKHDDKYNRYDSRNRNNFIRRYDDVYNDKRRRQDREERRRREEEELRKRREERKKRHAALEKKKNYEEDKYKTELKKENKHAEQQKERRQDKSIESNEIYKGKEECKKDSTKQPGISSKKESITQEHAVSSNKTSITKKHAVNSKKRLITKEATNNAILTDRQARITSNTSRAKISPTKLRMMQDKTTDKSFAEYQQSIGWEILRKSIHGLITKINVDNVLIISHMLLREDIVRGRNLFCRSILLIQAEHLDLTNAYAALVAIINSRFPNIGELLLKRLVFQFKLAYSRNDKKKCVTVSSFIADLINQKVAHGVLGFELLTLLIETPTDDSVEIAIDFLKQCGFRLNEVSITAVNSAFKSLKNTLVKSKLHRRIQYMIEEIFKIRKKGFRNQPPIIKKLELVEDMDQFTHRMVLNPPERYETGEAFDAFMFDSEYKANEKVYMSLLSSSSSNHSRNTIRCKDFDYLNSSYSSSSDDDDDDDGDDKNRPRLNFSFHDTIYFLLDSSHHHDICVKKIMEIDLTPELQIELCTAIVYYCGEYPNHSTYCGFISLKLCTIDTAYISAFEHIFKNVFNNVYRFGADRVANSCKLFAVLLYTDTISWNVLQHIYLNEFETNRLQRLFIKHLFKRLTETMGFKRLNAKLNQDEIKNKVTRIFPIYCPQDALFSINFFTSIGLRELTNELRLFLNSSPHYKLGIKSKISAVEKEESESVKNRNNLLSPTDSSGSCSTSVFMSSETDSKILTTKKEKREPLKNTVVSSSTKMPEYSKFAPSLSLKMKIKRGEAEPLKNINNLSSSSGSVIVVTKKGTQQSKNTVVSSSTKSSASSSSSSSDIGSGILAMKKVSLSSGSKIYEKAMKKKMKSLKNSDDSSLSSIESSETDSSSSSSSSDESRSDQKYEVKIKNVSNIKKDSSKQDSKYSTSSDKDTVLIKIQLPTKRREEP